MPRVTERRRADLLHMDRLAGYEIVKGGLRRDGHPVLVPKGLLYLALARAGWKGEDGPLSVEFVQRLRGLDPRLAHLFLKTDHESAA